jgi:hypothetical protein
MTTKFATINFDQKNKIVEIIFNGVPSESKNTAHICEIEKFMYEMNCIYDKYQKFNLLFDATQVGFVPMKHLKKISKFFQEKDDETKEKVRKCAIVVKYTIFKNMVNFALSLKTPVCEVKTFSDRNQSIIFIM